MTLSKQIQAVIRSWDKDFINVPEMLDMVRSAFPDTGNPEIESAFESVARGPISPASPCAAGSLCNLVGLGDPLDTAFNLFNSSDSGLSEPQWFLWIAGYTYNWVCNSGLSSCYFEFPVRQYGDRIRVYEAIGAHGAAAVMREADLAFGDDGPPPVVEDRSSWFSDDAYARIGELSSQFRECGDEIFTRAYLYAMEHPSHFTPVKPDQLS